MVKINKYFLPYVIILLMLGFKEKIIFSFILVFLHELIHCAVARVLGFKGFNIEILPIGAVLKLKDIEEASAKEDLIIALSAPAFNVFLGILFYFLYGMYGRDLYYTFFQYNMIIGGINLIPAFPLDGGRIVRDVIRSKTVYKVANKATVYISIFIGIILMGIYLFLFFGGNNNISLGMISIFIMISSLNEKNRMAYVIMSDIINKQDKFVKRGYIENNSISVYYKKDLLNVISIIEKNKYNIFLVLDENMNIIDTLYESDILEGLKLYGNISLEELCLVNNE
ncbi:M50 family metallopeptidase [Clostridium cochlearium]|uniref:M50 family metallopeptidase n=1 Tax=Clostridium cochlearium TaxID=1494 RepID=UPI001EDE1A33|nr:M50 family metallopeptidase [Clostridium cochlearium]MBV1817199.1 M50 family metallopeptidase [Bacteroidales bacterium MSK.15.36]MCG4571377.1 M50 family metallopeptidase [Clostridium cochlearium]MCR1971622.1 M50 family metallopeptidase [Clostridium cochlearium]